MNNKNIAKALVLAGVALWIASATVAKQGNRMLGDAFPSTLLVSPESCTTPEWPREARRYEIEGISVLRFQIGMDGSVEDAKLVKSSSWEMLDEAALRAIMKCQFKPGLSEAAKKDTFPIQFVWTLSGSPSMRPLLVPDSCAASDRFSGFEGFNRHATTSDGMLVRFLVNGQGEPFGVKVEAKGDDAGLGNAAAEFVKTCKFAIDPELPGERTDTVFGRVLYKRR